MKRIRAFTLIELLVVIAVIAVLMGILMPALKKAKEQGQSAACMGNLKGYTLAVAMFAQDNDDKFPDHAKCYFYTSDQLPGENVTGPSFRHQRWCNMQVNLKRRPELAGEFFKYLVDARGLICPSFKQLAKNKGVVVDKNAKWDAMEDDSIYEPWHNYTMNAFLGPKRGNTNTDGIVQKTSQVKDAANVFVFADEGPFFVEDYNYQGLNDTSLWVVFAADAARDLIKQYGTKWNVKPGPDGIGQFCDIIAGFHNAPSGDVTGGKGNCTFADGHVAAVKRDDSFAVAWPK